MASFRLPIFGQLLALSLALASARADTAVAVPGTPGTPGTPAYPLLPQSQVKENPLAAQTEPEAVIPKAPNAPPKLLAPKIVEQFGCDRYFTYKGKTLVCDSSVRQDAENIRVVVRDVPAAVAELDTYDYNRANLKNSAYWGSAGLVIALLGVLVAPHVSNNPVAVRGATVIAGLGLAAGSFIYASGILRTNEAHIGNAVNDFNSLHPESPIELQFSTGITF